jgi:transposase
VAAPRKYDEETRARAVRMYQERIRDLGESKLTARRAVGAVLDINPATLRNWVEREEIDIGVRPGVTTEASDELKALRREVAELRRANETSHAVILSSGVCDGAVLVGGEGDGLVVGVAGFEAVVEHTEEPVEQVALGGDVAVSGGFAAVVVGSGSG